MLTGAEQVGTVVMSAGAGLLLWAGAPKLLTGIGTPRERRRDGALGALETALALFILLGPGRLAAGLLGAVFLAFSAVHLRDLSRIRGPFRPGPSCNCFGADEDVDPGRALALTVMMAAAAGVAALIGAPSLREVAGSDGPALAWLPSAALGLTVVWRLAFSGLEPLQHLVDITAARLGGGLPTSRDRARTTTAGTATALTATSTSATGLERRSFLLRVAVIGSALAVAPVRFLLYPGTALGAVVRRPSECSTGLCTDGYTAFCCEITGGANTCPTGTFPGGWWMCTDYRGRQLCSDQGHRYYVDCNNLPGEPFPGGCTCANGNCNERKVACNVFRYGQCNTQIEGTTTVVCRMIVCENPASISALNCSASLAVDNATCDHEAPCLEPHAVQLAGAGGA